MNFLKSALNRIDNLSDHQVNQLLATSALLSVMVKNKTMATVTLVTLILRMQRNK